MVSLIDEISLWCMVSLIDGILNKQTNTRLNSQKQRVEDWLPGARSWKVMTNLDSI